MSGSAVVSSRALVVGLGLSLVAPLAAQQVQPDATDSQARFQIRLYETALKQAVLRAGERLAERANEVVPGVQLSPATEPVAQWVPTLEGPVFNVQIPLLLSAGIDLMKLLQDQQQQTQAASTPAMPVAQGPSRVSGQGVVAADPMAQSPVLRGSFQPDKEYTAFAREALIDALLDNSSGLPLKDGERLEIAASGFEVNRGALYPDVSRKLVLVISAADLTAFRQGKITRDDAKAKIIEKRY